jgi:hypothetical protein
MVRQDINGRADYSLQYSHIVIYHPGTESVPLAVRTYYSTTGSYIRYFIKQSFAWRLRALPTCFHRPTKIHCARGKTSMTQSNPQNDQQCLVRMKQFRQTRSTPCLSYSQHFGTSRRLFHAVFIANVALELGIKKCDQPAPDVWCDSCDGTLSPVRATNNGK